MRDPSNSGCPGPLAVSVSVIMAWMGSFGLSDWCERAGRRAGPFQSLHDQDVGSTVLRELDEPWDSFRAWLRANPAVVAVLRAAGTAMAPSDDGNPAIDSIARQSFSRLVAPDVGKLVKASAWWRENLPEIKRNQRRVKEVRRVLES